MIHGSLMYGPDSANQIQSNGCRGIRFSEYYVILQDFIKVELWNNTCSGSGYTSVNEGEKHYWTALVTGKFNTEIFKKVTKVR